MVPDIAMIRNTLVSSWKEMLQQASIKLLKDLKRYHHNTIASLSEQTDVITVSLKNRRGWPKPSCGQQVFWNMTVHPYYCKKEKLKSYVKKASKNHAPISDVQKRNHLPNNWTNNSLHHIYALAVNISNKPLSDSEINLLSKGCSFCPKPPSVDSFQVKKGLGQVFRGLSWLDYIYDQEDNQLNHITIPFTKKILLETPA